MTPFCVFPLLVGNHADQRTVLVHKFTSSVVYPRTKNGSGCCIASLWKMHFNKIYHWSHTKKGRNLDTWENLPTYRLVVVAPLGPIRTTTNFLAPFTCLDKCRTVGESSFFGPPTTVPEGSTQFHVKPRLAPIFLLIAFMSPLSDEAQRALSTEHCLIGWAYTRPRSPKKSAY